jgi:prepilin-type N-terminal cleavage/methylation domain-containing protein
MMRKGFTLIEMVVVTALLALVILAVMGVFFNSMKATALLRTEQKIDESGKLVTERIGRGIRSMASIQNYDTVCDGLPKGSITMVNREGQTVELTCVADRITLGGESISPSNLTADCADFNVSCNTADKSPVVEVNFSLTAAAGTYDSGVEKSRDFSTEVMIRGF